MLKLQMNDLMRISPSQVDSIFTSLPSFRERSETLRLGGPTRANFFTLSRRRHFEKLGRLVKLNKKFQGAKHQLLHVQH